MISAIPCRKGFRPFFNDEFGTTFKNIYALTGPGLTMPFLKTMLIDFNCGSNESRMLARSSWSVCRTKKSGSELSNLKWPPWGFRFQRFKSPGRAERHDRRAFLKPLDREFVPEGQWALRIGQGSREFFQSVQATVISELVMLPKSGEGFRPTCTKDALHRAGCPSGLAVSMKRRGDILVLGEALEQEFARLQQNLPAGMFLHKV